MAFGDHVSQGKNKLATGNSAINTPTYDVWYMLVGKHEWEYLCACSADIGIISDAVKLLFGDNLCGIEIALYNRETE